MVEGNWKINHLHLKRYYFTIANFNKKENENKKAKDRLNFALHLLLAGECEELMLKDLLSGEVDAAEMVLHSLV